MEKICVFQCIKDSTDDDNKAQLVTACALTVSGDFGEDWEECNPDICPHYQSWKLHMEQMEKK